MQNWQQSIKDKCNFFRPLAHVLFFIRILTDPFAIHWDDVKWIDCKARVTMDLFVEAFPP